MPTDLSRPKTDLSKKSEHESLDKAEQWVKIHHRGAKRRDSAGIEGGHSFWVDGDTCVALVWDGGNGKWFCAMAPMKYVRW
jgi:hypothetical protein